jgi:hypothetical protein
VASGSARSTRAAARSAWPASQAAGGGLVGPDGGRGQVPGPLVALRLAAEDLGKGAVGGLPGRQGGRPVGGRADQGVPEGQPAVPGADQPGRLGLVERVRRDPEPGAGAQHHRRVAGRLGRRHQQQGARLLGQAPDPLAEGPLQPGGQREHVLEGRPPGELVGGQRPGQLQQGQGVAAGPLDQPLDHLGGQVEAVPGEQGRRRLRVEALEAQLGQAGGREVAGVAVAGGEQAHHPLGLQPPGGEGQRLRRRAVQPLGLVDQAQQRPLLGRLAEQAQHRHRDQEPVVGPAREAPALRGAEAEGAAEGRRLRAGQPAGQAQHGPEQLVQGGERQLGLGLDPGRPEHRHPLGLPGGMVEQRGLAGAGLAADHQHPAARPAGVREQPFQGVALGASAVEHYRDASPTEQGGAPWTPPPIPARAVTARSGRTRPPSWPPSTGACWAPGR